MIFIKLFLKENIFQIENRYLFIKNCELTIVEQPHAIDTCLIHQFGCMKYEFYKKMAE